MSATVHPVIIKPEHKRRTALSLISTSGALFGCIVATSFALTVALLFRRGQSIYELYAFNIRPRPSYTTFFTCATYLFLCVLEIVLLRLTYRKLYNMYYYRTTNGNDKWNNGIKRFILGFVEEWIKAWKTDDIVTPRQKAFQKYGETRYIDTHLFQRHSALATIDPVVVEHILKTNYNNYLKYPAGHPEIFPLKVGFLRDGIFASNHGPKSADQGRMWYFQRKIASKIFTKKNFRTLFAKTFSDYSHDVINLLHASQGEVVDWQQISMRYTMDVIGKIGFGIEFDTLKALCKLVKTKTKEGRKCYPTNCPFEDVGLPNPFDALGMARPIMKATETKAMNPHVEFMELFDNTQEKVIARVIRPGWFTALGSVLYFDEIIVRRNVKRIDAYCMSIIRKRRAILKDNEHEHEHEHENDVEDDNILSMFLNYEKNAKKNMTKTTANDLETEGEEFYKQAPELTDEILRDIILSFIIAGRDTTAATLTWMMYFLSRDRNALTLVQTELHQLYQHNNDTTVTHEDVMQNLPYMRAALYETLRLRPPVQVDPKYTIDDDTLPNGMKVQGGTRISIDIRMMGINPRIYGRDAETFNIHRFYQKAKPNAFVFPVFQAGRRICIGMDMALFEASVLCAKVLHKFDVKWCGGDDLPTEPMGVILWAKIPDGCDRKEAMPLKFIPIEKPSTYVSRSEKD